MMIFMCGTEDDLIVNLLIEDDLFQRSLLLVVMKSLTEKPCITFINQKV